jgi:two-component system chemotaxis sensor kinase CheA
VTQAAPVFPPPSAREAAAPAEAAGEQVRVPAAGLDRLLASAGELTVASSRLETRAPELEVLRDSAAGLAREWQRLAHHVSAALERTGARPEVAGAVAGLGDELRRLAGAAEQAAAASRDDARRVTRAAAEVSDRAHRLRMRPFADACDALPRVVRDVARSAGKRARLEVRGGRVDADRAVIDALREILLHLVRNAVDHGIRAPEVRARAGKAEEGRVVVAAALRGDRLQVTVSDDGAGLNEAAVRGQLARRGLPVPDSPAALGRALFEAGFSTRDQADAISGRGVGLDAVRDAVARIRGSVEVTWEAGRGTTFHLECPVSLASVRVLLAEVDGQLLALPTAAVEHLERVQPERLRQAEGRPVLVGEGAPVPVVSLARVLGPPFAERPAERAAVAVRLAAGERRLAVVVDGLLAEQEVVVRPLERIRVPLRHVSGAALLAGGDVALVLDPAALLATGLAPGAGITLAGAPAQPARRRVLVVDDSVTTRTLEQSILEAAGCEVLTAVDGAEAWERLQDEPCDLVVSDVEMPRMDGFALCRAIRESRRFRTLPVVLVTALEHEEDRARGLEAGADAYLVKSSFDQQELLDTIRELVG